MSSIQTNVDLLLATMDLKLVQMVRGAMHAADVNAAAATSACGPSGGHPCCPAAKGAVVVNRQTDVFIESRRVIHPEPTYAPRVVFHPERIAKPVCQAPATPPIVIEVQPCDNKACEPSFFQPPWKVLPWENPSQPAPKIKIVRHQPDVMHKGSLIDFFI